MFRLNAFFGVTIEEIFQPLMGKGLDHEMNVTVKVTVVKPYLNSRILLNYAAATSGVSVGSLLFERPKGRGI